MATSRLFRRAAKVLGSSPPKVAVAGLLGSGSIVAGSNVLCNLHQHKPIACAGLWPWQSKKNIMHQLDADWAGGSDGQNHFADERFFMFWLESEKNGEFSNFHMADVHFPLDEFHSKLQPLLPADKRTGLVSFCCSEALMFTIKLNLMYTWAEANYAATDPARQDLVQKVEDAIAVIVRAKDGGTVKKASRFQTELAQVFNRQVWFTNVQAYVQYVIVWAKFRGSSDRDLLAQLQALQPGTVILEASPWDKIYGACPDKGYDMLSRDRTRRDPPHREGYPVGPHQAFLELLRGKISASGEIRWGPKNDLGLNYLGLAVEMVYGDATRERPGLSGLLGRDGMPVSSHTAYKQYSEFLSCRIA